MIEKWFNDLDEARRNGALVVLKFDGERKTGVYTFLISQPETDFVFRFDTDNLEKTIPKALFAYW